MRSRVARKQASLNKRMTIGTLAPDQFGRMQCKCGKHEFWLYQATRHLAAQCTSCGQLVQIAQLTPGLRVA